MSDSVSTQKMRIYNLMDRIEIVSGMMVHELLGDDGYKELMNRRDAQIIIALTNILDDITNK